MVQIVLLVSSTLMYLVSVLSFHKVFRKLKLVFLHLSLECVVLRYLSPLDEGTSTYYNVKVLL